MAIHEAFPKDIPQTLNSLSEFLNNESSTRLQLICLESIHDALESVPKAGENNFSSNISAILDLYYSILADSEKPFPTRIESAIGLTSVLEVLRAVGIVEDFIPEFKKGWIFIYLFVIIY